jgi:hypothetical protein
MDDFVRGGLLVLAAWALAYGTTQFTEWLRRKGARRERQEERRKDIYSRFLSELVGLPYSMDRALRLDNGAQDEVVSEIARRVRDLQTEIMLFGSPGVRECADEFVPRFRAFAEREAELGTEDAERPKEDRKGVANTYTAYQETIHPFVEKLAEAMRKDLA